MSDLVGNPEDRFSHNEAHFSSENCYFHNRKDCRVLHIKCAIMVMHILT